MTRRAATGRTLPYERRRIAELRAEWYERADYYAWCARRHDPPARDPLTGAPFRPYTVTGTLARQVGRAMYASAARAAYAIARAHPCPLP